MVAPRQSILFPIILIAQIIVSYRGNIGSCAIVTIDAQSYCTHCQCSPLCMNSFLIPNLPTFIYCFFFSMNIYIYIGSKRSLMHIILKRMAHSLLIIFFRVFSNILNNLFLEGSLWRISMIVLNDGGATYRYS